MEQINQIDYIELLRMFKNSDVLDGIILDYTYSSGESLYDILLKVFAKLIPECDDKNKLVETIYRIANKNGLDNASLKLGMIGLIGDGNADFINEIYKKVIPKQTMSIDNSIPSILIVFVNNIEKKQILSVLSERIKEESKIFYLENMAFWNCGTLGSVQIIAVQSDAGSTDTDGSTLTTFDAIHKINPIYVFAIGIAFGSNQKNQKIGDILISTKVQNYEKQRIGTNTSGDEYTINRGREYNIKTKIKGRLNVAIGDFNIPIHQGIILSGEKVVDNYKFLKKLIDQFPEAIGGEMEATGVASACERTNMEWVVIKAICDFADGNKKFQKNKRQIIAAKNAACFLVHLIQKNGLSK